MSPRREWSVVVAVAVAWAVGPALPALLAGGIPGHPYTDLYPSVWGMGVVADAWPALPTHTDWLGAPDGMGFYYSSPIHGWLGAPLTKLFGAATSYTATLLVARALTVICAFGCFRSRESPLPLGLVGALGAALVYGAAPFFQGYAVEGIVEGTDGWALPLWAWAVLSRNRAAPLAFALTIVSSWYLGMVACLLAAIWGLRDRRAWASGALGLLLAAPFLWSFLHAFSGASPLTAEVRALMGAPLPRFSPGFGAELHPFAITTWLGLSIPVFALASARRAPALFGVALLCALLSTGRGPWWELPVLHMVRFPYRWHAGTLLLLAPLVGATIERLRHPTFWLTIPWLEGWLFSPIEPILPVAPADVSPLYSQVEGPVLLEVPGPVALPPGVINRSRPRARYLLFAQLSHHARSPWVPDFNGVSANQGAPWLGTFLSYDPILRDTPTTPDVDAARAAGVTQVMVHRDELRQNASVFEAALVAAGARLVAVDAPLALYAL